MMITMMMIDAEEQTDQTDFKRASFVTTWPARAGAHTTTHPPKAPLHQPHAIHMHTWHDPVHGPPPSPRARPAITAGTWR